MTEVTSQPLRRIAVDITEMPVSACGNRYAVVIMDYFSKFVRVYPVKRQDAETVTTVLLDWVYDLGVPDRIHSDQGGQFESDLFQQMCRRLGIQKTRTTPYHPESDGMVERFMRTLKDMVAKYIDPQGQGWDTDIKAYTMAYNSSIHAVTGYSPFFLLHGFNPKMPLEATMAPPDDAVPIRSYLAERLKAISSAYKQVMRKTQESANKMAARYDEHASGEAYTTGDRVWIRDHRASVGGKPKLGLYYKGPGTIISRLGGERGVTYRVRDDKGREKVLHFNQLKPALERNKVQATENPKAQGEEITGTEAQDEPTNLGRRDEEITGTRKTFTGGSDDQIGDLMAYYSLTRNPAAGGPPERPEQTNQPERMLRPGGNSATGGAPDITISYVTRGGRTCNEIDRLQVGVSKK